ncbi:uncharacterized protein PHACADRAFT_112900 [Phanerochaete carnosa HHB-10118-sp]|uniref:Uncharacterized protein n=1 Tax=Phanerochaete carnosa (strain HHB-10118-sp) TaxID=650164 RepID=K5W4K4_PHACS|nr:uncharacterized protein PHACADRAFT_112900 [Phanerochaete carnosa HHB-10118-sp]EKM58803.1 hypothetical protein PHACADRAFT_112900 [Phanerochaete carnosa HHB-10118-sp]
MEEDLDVGVPELKGEGEIPDPLDILLDYMLEVSLLNPSDTTNAETVIASDDDVESIVVPRTLARSTITPTDLVKWPGITLDGAGLPGARRVFIGPTETEARSLKLRQLVFADSLNPSASCTRFSLSTDGKLLAACFGSSDILVWRLPDGLPVQRLHPHGHAKDVLSLAFSPDNRSLVSGSGDTTAIVWDIRHGRVFLRLEGHHGAVKRAVYAPHGALIATASQKVAMIWNASTGACLHSFDIEGMLYEVAFSLNNPHIYVDQGGPCLIYETQTYTRIAELRHGEKSCESAESHQGDRIVTASPNGQVKIWSALTGQQLFAIDYPGGLSYPVTFSPDGSEILAACDPDETAVTFDSWTGELRRVYQLAGKLHHASYCPSRDYVALGDGAGDLRVCDAKSGAFLARFQALNTEINREVWPRFLFGGRNLVANFSDGLSLLHDMQDVLRLR